MAEDTESPPVYVRLTLDGAPPPVRETRTELGDEGAYGRSIKVALAMKGGVSLAVWIGGAVAELDLLRRIRLVTESGRTAAFLVADSRGSDMSDHTLRRADLYASALAVREYDRVEFDVLAGASAGGLNGILYSVAQRAGANVDTLLDVWIRYGAIWKLLHPGGTRDVNSVLQGDYFWRGIREAIETFYTGDNSALHETHDISLDLSATIRDTDYRALLPRREGRGHFHFVSSSDPMVMTRGRDIPAARSTGPDFERSVSRLAYAARTTSSFPGAFEPSLIWSPTSPDNDVLSTHRLDMRYAFSAHRDGLAPFRVIDGGVLDNVPIDRITRALRERVPEKHIARIVLYLDPSPDRAELGAAPPEPLFPPHTLPPSERARHRARIDALSRFVPTIIDGLFMRGIRESSDAEVTDLQRYRRALYLRRGRMETFGYAMGSEIGPGTSGTLQLGYRYYRVAADVDQLTEVLSDPDLWQLGTDLRNRLDLPPIPIEDLQSIDNLLNALYLSRDDRVSEHSGKAVLEGSRAAWDAAAAGLDWLRQLDAQAFWDPASPARKPHHVIARQRARVLLRRAASTSRRELDRRIRRLLTKVHSGAGAPNVQLLGTFWCDIESARGSALMSAWKDIEDALSELRAVTAEMTTWSSAWKRFADSDLTWTDLGPFAASSGIPDPTFAVRYVTITGAEPAQLEFPALREAQLAATATSWLKRGTQVAFEAAAKPGNVPAHLDDGAKLAGSRLGNFGAFLSGRWRRNDWWWGRLDASSGILRIIDGLPLASHRQGASVRVPPALDPINERRASAQGLVVRQMNESGDSAIPIQINDDATTIAKHMTAGSQGPFDLREHYVVGVLSRLARVAFRATIAGRPLLVKALLSGILSPLLMLIPLVAAPMRALFVGTTVAVGLQLIWKRKALEPGSGLELDLTIPSVGMFIVLGLMVAVFVVAAIQVGRGERRRASLRERVPEMRDRLDTRMKAAKRRSAWFIAGAATAGAGGIALTLLIDAEPTARSWWLIGLSVAGSVGAIVTARSLPTPSLRGRTQRLWIAATATVLVVAVALAVVDPGALTAAPTMGVVITLIAFTLGFGWVRRWRRLGWLTLVSLGTGAVGGLVIWAMTAFFHGNVVFTPPAAAALVTWLVTSYLFWFLTDGPHYGSDTVKDDPLVEEIPDTDRAAAPVATA